MRLTRLASQVLNMATRCPNAFEDEGVFTYKSMLLEDSLDTDIKSALGECVAFINEALASGGKVLVHCQAGVRYGCVVRALTGLAVLLMMGLKCLPAQLCSRSATAVLGYLMRSEGMTLGEAWDYTVARRPVIRPNYGAWCIGPVVPRSCCTLPAYSSYSTRGSCVNVGCDRLHATTHGVGG